MTDNTGRSICPSSIPIRECDGGYVAEGRGFYIWDEERSEVLRFIRALTRGHYDVAPTGRLLVMPDAFVPGLSEGATSTTPSREVRKPEGRNQGTKPKERRLALYTHPLR